MKTKPASTESRHRGAWACLGLILLLAAVVERPARAQIGTPGNPGDGSADGAAVMRDPSWTPGAGFRCQVVGRPGEVYEIQVSDGLSRWETLSQFLMTQETQEVRVPTAVNFARSFYRLVGPLTETSAAIADLVPRSASPGMPVRLSTREGIFDEDGKVRVEVAGAHMETRWLGNPSEVEFMTPVVSPGDVLVRLHEPGKLPGPPAAFQVLPARNQQLVFHYAADGVRLLQRRESGNNRNLPAPPDASRLSLDFLNEEGGLVATTSVPHPAEAHVEVHGENEEGEAVMRHGVPPADGHFDVKVPNIPGAFWVRIHEAMPGLDIRTAEGRAKRRFVEEIVVNP